MISGGVGHDWECVYFLEVMVCGQIETGFCLKKHPKMGIVLKGC